MTALANALALRHLKVLLKLFQKLAVSKGSHLRQSLWSLSAESETLYTS